MKLSKSAIKQIETNLSKGQTCEISLVGNTDLRVKAYGGEKADIDLAFPLLLPVDPATQIGEIRVQAVKDGKFMDIFLIMFEGQRWLLGLKARREQQRWTMVNKDERIVLTSKGLAAANAIANESELTDDQLSRIDLLANLALQGRPRKVLKCNVCGVEYSGQKDFAYAESMRFGWAASCRAEGEEPKGICPCPSRTCQGELVVIGR